MKNFKFIIHGNEYEVNVKDFEENIAHIEVNGTSYDVEIERKVKTSKTPRLIRPLTKEPAKPSIDKKDRGDASPLTAPLPGNILKILVSPGDIIKAGQPVMIMEAMKMENQVLADKDGVVENIRVQTGQSVLQGDVLLEII